MGKASPEIEVIRARINEKHERALQALSLINRYLDEELPLADQLSIGSKRTKRYTISIRDKVLRATAEFLSIDDIVARTGCTRRQVRGVITAPDLKGKFEKKVNGAAMTTYRYNNNTND